MRNFVSQPAKPHWHGVAIGCLLAAVAGCSDLTAQLSGTVYVDDKPLTLGDAQRGMIVFRPVAGGATCTGLVDADGGYSVATGTSKALVPGDYLVSVRVVELLKPEVEGQAPNGRPVTPAVYADPLTSGLTVNVARGANQYDIKLDSQAGPAVLPVESPDEEGEEGLDEEAPPQAENVTEPPTSPDAAEPVDSDTPDQPEEEGNE